MATIARDYIQRLADRRFEGEMRNAFLDALDRVAADIDLDELARAIEQGAIETAIRIVGLDPERFDGLRGVAAAAMAAAGRETAKIVPPKSEPDLNQLGGDNGPRRTRRIKFTFKPGTPRAEAAVERLHTELMRGLQGGPNITTEGAQAIRSYIRAGLERGKNPRDIARAIRGTFDPRTQSFRGGVLGLTDHQAGVVQRAEDQLRSGDPEELRKYLGRKLRDRRFDRSVIAAINGERDLSEDQIRKMVNAYQRGWIRHRAETVARDQALSALTIGQEEALDQAVEARHVRNEDILQYWVTAGDSRVRDAHGAVPGLNTDGVRRGEAFETPLGPMRYPRDPRGSAENRINCRCTLLPRVQRRRPET